MLCVECTEPQYTVLQGAVEVMRKTDKQTNNSLFEHFDLLFFSLCYLSVYLSDYICLFFFCCLIDVLHLCFVY
jgi:hypothetical protein